MKSTLISLLFQYSILLSVIRSYDHCQKLTESLSLVDHSIQQLQEEYTHASEEQKTSIITRLYKFYSAKIEVECHNKQGEEALQTLHQMLHSSNPPTPIPRSCYLQLFSYFSGNPDQMELHQLKEKLQDM